MLRLWKLRKSTKKKKFRIKLFELWRGKPRYNFKLKDSLCRKDKKTNGLIPNAMFVLKIGGVSTEDIKMLISKIWTTHFAIKSILTAELISWDGFNHNNDSRRSRFSIEYDLILWFYKFKLKIS